MHTGQLITGLEATVDTRMPEFVMWDECAEAAKQMMAEKHPDLATITSLGNALTTFCITFATMVAYQCAAEATRRAIQKGEPCAKTASSTKSIIS